MCGVQAALVQVALAGRLTTRPKGLLVIDDPAGNRAVDAAGWRPLPFLGLFALRDPIRKMRWHRGNGPTWVAQCRPDQAFATLISLAELPSQVSSLLD